MTKDEIKISDDIFRKEIRDIVNELKLQGVNDIITSEELPDKFPENYKYVFLDRFKPPHITLANWLNSQRRISPYPSGTIAFSYVGDPHPFDNKIVIFSLVFQKESM